MYNSIKITLAIFAPLIAGCSSLERATENAAPDPIFTVSELINNGFVYFKGQTRVPAAFHAFDVTEKNIRFQRGSKTFRAHVMYVRLNNGDTWGGAVRYLILSEQPDVKGNYSYTVIVPGGKYKPL